MNAIRFAVDRRTVYPRSRAARPTDEQTWTAHPWKRRISGGYAGECGACPFSVNDPIHA